MNKTMTRIPSHPGEILKELYMEPLSLAVPELSKRLGISQHTLETFINGKTALSADMAIRLAEVFNTTPESWLNTQRNYDLWKLQHWSNRLNENNFE